MIEALVLIFAVLIAWYIGYKVGSYTATENAIKLIEAHVPENWHNV